jgi:hypothetical protein
MFGTNVSQEVVQRDRKSGGRPSHCCSTALLISVEISCRWIGEQIGWDQGIDSLIKVAELET